MSGYVPFYGVTLPPLKPFNPSPPPAVTPEQERAADEAYQFHHRMVRDLVQAYRDSQPTDEE
jgi:hypothetical protein